MANTNIFDIPTPKKLSVAQRAFIALEMQKPSIQKWHEDMQMALEAVEKEVGIDGYFQDANGTVYKVTRPEGKFVFFEKFGYLRTRRDGETRGSLSVKEAKEHGFRVPE